MLHELDLSPTENYSTINLKLFTSIKDLKLSLTHLTPPGTGKGQIQRISDD